MDRANKRVVYVYIDNNYYPYDENGVTVKNPEVAQPPTSTPSPDKGKTFNSPDNKCMVQIFGDYAEAFLYDTSAEQPMFIKYLGKGVNNVRFSSGSNNKPYQILLDYKDGSFALFTSSGEPVDSEVPSSAPEPPKSSPGPEQLSIPPKQSGQ